jgi:pimeloyl-ACP methyl ester carboxylesterase
MSTVTSADGTPIAYTTTGSGPALVLVDGAMCHRGLGPSRQLAQALSGAFTVTAYDRRGRGESGSTAPYAVERELEDLAAVIEAAGGRASLLGISSGAVLTLRAAGAGLPVDRIVTYEAPIIVDDATAPLPADFVPTLEGHLAAGREGAAVKQFFAQVGMPKAMAAVMSLTPMWPKLKRVARTLPHDFAILDGLQAGRPLAPGLWPRATMPALVLVGGRSPASMHSGQAAIADALPDAELRVLEGQTHMVKAKAVAPAVTPFLLAATRVPAVA